MKLFTKYSRINILATISIFLIASATYYFTLHYVLINQIDEDLKIEEREIVTYTREHNRLPESISVKDQMINYQAVNTPFSQRYFTTTKLKDAHEKNKENFRQLIFGIKTGTGWYKATVSKSLEDTDDLINSILLVTFSTILLILVVSLIINRVVLRRIWKPFYHTLDAAKSFKVSKTQKLFFPATGIEEFDLMNQTMERLTKQAQVDYLSLKTFSENASHEMQTPLAVIRSKLDLLIQDEQLTEEQSKKLQSAYNAIERLTKLNQSLLLLAKIENKQYEEVQTIHLKDKVEDKREEFYELWQGQNLNVTFSLADVVLHMNTNLADIFLNNLLSNATRHNLPGGSIQVELTHDHLLISNTSSLPPLDKERLFSRFYKSSFNNNNSGLGLSIIKQICDVSGFSINYLYANNLHSFVVNWNNQTMIN
jgi:signal transduction histidine kinase